MTPVVILRLVLLRKKKGKKNKTHSTFVVDKPSDRPIGIRIQELLVD